MNGNHKIPPGVVPVMKSQQQQAAEAQQRQQAMIGQLQQMRLNTASHLMAPILAMKWQGYAAEAAAHVEDGEEFTVDMEKGCAEAAHLSAMGADALMQRLRFPPIPWDQIDKAEDDRADAAAKSTRIETT